MPCVTTNITRAEARSRSRILRVRDYRIELDLSEAARASTFPSRTTVRFACAEPGSDSWIDLIAEPMVSATLNGSPLDLSGYDGARLELPRLRADNELVVEAHCRYRTSGEGMHRSVDPADGAVYLYTQFVTAEARRVFACFEQPDLKARFTWAVTAPAGWEVASNSDRPDPGPAGPGLAHWEFAPTQPISTYLAAVCAGPFHVEAAEYAGPHGTYPLRLLVRSSIAPHLDAEEILAITRAGLAHYEREFSVPYPFGSYDQVFLPEFNLGAMENPGMVTFREDLFVFRSRVTRAARDERATVMLHEMAHMWFGDLVTMRWWDDLWLNESFAEWSGFHVSAVAAGLPDAWTAFALARKGWAYAQDQLPSTHPIVADMVDLEAVYLNFDGITYAKGASVLKQLVAYVGYPAFLHGLNRYFEAHAWGSASLGDLLVELERASDRDLGQWARVWLQEPGVTTLVPHVNTDEEGRYARVRIEQLPPNRPEGLAAVMRPHRVAVGLYRWQVSDGVRSLVRDRRLEIDVHGPGVDVPELIGVAAADLLLLNDDDLTYAKVRLDPASLATATGGIGALRPSLPRALVWAALWEMVRDGLLPAQRFVEIALSGLADEDVPATIDVLRRNLRRTLTAYVAPELRAGLAARACQATAALLDAAEPGSDRQLALALLHVETATTPGWLNRLAELLSGQAVIPGLVLDADLRWQVLIRLAALGVVGDLVDDELARDATTKGQQYAAQARAARPDEAAKEEAWRAAVADDPVRLPNAALAATVAGFADPEAPTGLMSRYRHRYAEQVVPLWQSRSPVEAQILARGLFPAPSEEAVAIADSLLARPELPSGLHRVLVEARAEAGLALALQDVSRAAGMPLGE
jgi:aminopeptidase N